MKKAPHKDIVNIDVPSQKRGKRTYPATVAWRVSIGTLSSHHHKIITSYSLSHAQSFILVRSRARFERALRDLDAFNRGREEKWESRGMRFERQPAARHHHRGEQDTLPTDAEEKMTVKDYMSVLDEICTIIKTAREGVPRTKEMTFKSWLALRIMEEISSGMVPRGKSSPSVVDAHPAVLAAFEAAYPPKPPDHRDLITIGFDEFFHHGIGEESFAQMSLDIHAKISELTRADNFKALFEAAVAGGQTPADSPAHQANISLDKISTNTVTDYRENPSFQSVVRAAQIFGVLKWLFEERQDILATFVQRIAVPADTMTPRVNPSAV